MQAEEIIENYLNPMLCSRVLGEPVFVLLFGDLGSGKTFLTKKILSVMGCSKDDVTSPTFDIYHIYGTKNYGTVCHMDLYRLNSAAELFGIGFDDIMKEADIFFVEWPQLLIETGLVTNCLCVDVELGTVVNGL